MSSTPPPPPFAPAPYTASDRRWQRRALREQGRAAAAAARQQRILYRAQMRASRRSSVLGPLLLVALGCFFLLREVGVFRWDLTLGWFARWWPLVLVGAGLVLLGEWALDLWMADGTNAPLPRRTLGGGGVLLLTLLALVGAADTTLHNHSGWLQRNLDTAALDSSGLDQIFARHSDTVRELSQPLPPGGLFVIRSHRGNLTITGTSQDGRVHVSAHQRLWAWQSRDLHRLQEQDRPTLRLEGQNLVLAVNGTGRDETDVTIDLPHEASVEIGAAKGQIAISELRGPVTIQDHSGEIVLTALTGHILVTSLDDNATISGHSLTGDLTVKGRAGDLTFSDLSGPLALQGDFFGTTHLERVKGSVHFQSSFTTFTCAGIPGHLNIAGRTELEASGLSGPVMLSTTNRNVSLTDVDGSANLSNKEGSVTLSVAAPLGPVNVSTTNGSVHLKVPPSAGFHLNASTTNGQVSNELGLTPEQHGNSTTLAGQVRTGGPVVQLHTTDGDIDVRKSDPVASSPHPRPGTDVTLSDTDRLVSPDPSQDRSTNR